MCIKYREIQSDNSTTIKVGVSDQSDQSVVVKSLFTDLSMFLSSPLTTGDDQMGRIINTGWWNEVPLHEVADEIHS